MSAITFPHETVLSTSAGGVGVSVYPCDGYGHAKAILRFNYSGPRAALIECGAISADLMAPQRRGHRRVDEDGDVYQRQHYKHHTTVGRCKPLDSPTLPKLPGYLPDMIPAARDALAAERAAVEQREREDTEKNKPRRRGPEAWRDHVRQNARVGSLLEFTVRKWATDSEYGLVEGYRMRESDLVAILAYAMKAEADLEQMIEAMHIDRVQALRLVVNNA